MSAFIQHGLQKSQNYYSSFISATHPVGVRHTLPKDGKPLADADARKKAYNKPKAMTALCNEMKARLTQQRTYARYDARILASQKAGATTTIPVLCVSSRDDVPSITVTFKPAAHVTGVLQNAIDIMTQYEDSRKAGEQMMVTTADYTSYQQTLEDAIHILGKSGQVPADCRASVGTVPEPFGETSVSMDVDTDDDDESSSSSSDDDSGDSDNGHEESKGSSNKRKRSNEATTNATAAAESILTAEALEPFKPSIKFDRLVDYVFPATIADHITTLLGTTVKSEVRAKDAQGLVHTMSELLVGLTAPTFCPWALYGVVEAVVIRVPSSNLYDATSGLRTVIHDLPGMVEQDAERAACFTGSMSTGLERCANAAIVHVVDNGDTPNEVFNGIIGAGVLTRLVTNPTSLRIVLVFPCDKATGVSLSDDEIATVKLQRTDEYQKIVKASAKKLLRSRKADKRQYQQELDQYVRAAMASIEFVIVETQPRKVTAALNGQTTDATPLPQLDYLCKAIHSFGTACWERTLISVVHELGLEVALQAYMPWQASQILMQRDNGTQPDGDSSTGGNSKNSSVKPWKDVKMHLNKAKTLLNDQVCTVRLYTYCRLNVCCLASYRLFAAHAHACSCTYKYLFRQLYACGNT
jgi:hypothetical protein